MIICKNTTLFHTNKNYDNTNHGEFFPEYRKFDLPYKKFDLPYKPKEFNIEE